MIFDTENMFFEDKALTQETIISDIIKVGPGEASDPLILYCAVKDAGTGTLAVSLLTSDTEAFTTSKTLGTWSELPIRAKLPRGNLGYLKLSAVSTYEKGTVTAGLIIDDDVLK